MKNSVPVRVAGGMVLAAALMLGQTGSGPIVSFTATSDKIAGAPDGVRIDLFRWSTDAERDRLVAAWSMTNAAGRGGRGGAGRGAGRGGRGAAAAGADPAPDPAAENNGDPFGTFGTAARAGRAGRGGGRGRGAPPAETPRPIATPEGTLATALKQAGTVGYLWSSETAGYAIRYASQVPGSAGVERVLLITDRRLGKTTDFWTLADNAAPSAYDFSVIELRVNAKGEGEGRISVTGKVAPDATAKIVAPENYEALPVLLKNLKRKTEAAHTEAK
jgi:hypothetical protein